MIDSTVFRVRYIQVIVPESWVGVVDESYGVEFGAFYIPHKGYNIYLM